MIKNIKKKITIIIFSYNRPKFLKRTVKYYLEENFKVLIVDGSNKKNSFIKNKNLRYIHTKSHYYKRVAIASRNLTTSYYIIANDDEFYMSSVIIKCVKFLEKNNDYIGAIGRTINFNYKYNKILGSEGYQIFNNKKNDNKKKIKRLKAHLRIPTNQGYNSVLRKTVLQKISFFLRKFNYKDNIYLIEFFINMIIILSGRLKLSNDLMWFRSQENNIISTKSWKRIAEEQMFFGSFKHFTYKKKLLIVKSFCKIINQKRNIDLILSEMIKRSNLKYDLYVINKRKNLLDKFKNQVLILKKKSNILNLIIENI